MDENSRDWIGSGQFARLFAANLLRLPDGQYALHSRGRTRLIGSKNDVLNADFLFCGLVHRIRSNLFAFAAIMFSALLLVSFLHGSSSSVAACAIISIAGLLFAVVNENAQLFLAVAPGHEVNEADAPWLGSSLAYMACLRPNLLFLLLIMLLVVVVTTGTELFDDLSRDYDNLRVWHSRTLDPVLKLTGLSHQAWVLIGDDYLFPLVVIGLLLVAIIHQLSRWFSCRVPRRDFRERYGVPLTRETYLVRHLGLDVPTSAEIGNEEGTVLQDRAREQSTRVIRLWKLVPLLSRADDGRYLLAAGRRSFLLSAEEVSGVVAGWSEFRPDKSDIRNLFCTTAAIFGLFLILATNFRSENLLLIYASVLAVAFVGLVVYLVAVRLIFLHGLSESVDRLYPGRQVAGKPMAGRYPSGAFYPVWSFVILPLALGAPLMALVYFDLWFCYIYGSCLPAYPAGQAEPFLRPVAYRHLDVFWAGLRFDVFLSALASFLLAVGAVCCMGRLAAIQIRRRHFMSAFGADLTLNSYLYRELKFPLALHEIAKWEPRSDRQ